MYFIFSEADEEAIHYQCLGLSSPAHYSLDGLVLVGLGRHQLEVGVESAVVDVRRVGHGRHLSGCGALPFALLGAGGGRQQGLRLADIL